MTAMLRSTRANGIHALCLLLVALCSSLLFAQTAAPSHKQPPQPANQDDLRTVHAIGVEHAPKLDGTLDDPLWQQATPITNFLQREPYEGQPPTERTEV